jgi:putative transposase
VLYAILYAIVQRVLWVSGIFSGAEAEVLVVRHELALLRRRIKRPRLRRTDRLFLAAMSRVLPRERWTAFIVTPATLVRWHRDLVQRKWTYRRRGPGRPPLDAETVDLIMRLGRENPRWGCVRIKGELQGLGLIVSATTEPSFVAPASGQRHAGSARPGVSSSPPKPEASWPAISSRSKRRSSRLCTCWCSCTSDSPDPRRGVSANPNGTWVTQQARNLMMALDDDPDLRARFLLRDRDAKYCHSFDAVFTAEGIEVVLTPYRTPQANCHVERLIGGLRREVLDHLLILGRRHLSEILGEYAAHHNSHRPHRGLALRCPQDARRRVSRAVAAGPVGTTRREILGGLIHEYHARAA